MGDLTNMGGMTCMVTTSFYPMLLGILVMSLLPIAVVSLTAFLRGAQTDCMLIVIPAYISAEITRGFQIGFLLYLPFIAVDLIVSNILMAMGMAMVSPMVISTPFKILLLSLVGGGPACSPGSP